MTTQLDTFSHLSTAAGSSGLLDTVDTVEWTGLWGRKAKKKPQPRLTERGGNSKLHGKTLSRKQTRAEVAQRATSSAHVAHQDRTVDLTQQTDEQLLHLIAEKNSAAFEVLYDRHARIVLGLILRIVHDQAVAEELLQEAFWQVWKKAGDFQGTGAGAAWIYRIARNKGLDQLRRQKARPDTVDTDADVEVLEAVTSDAAAQESPVEAQVERTWQQQQVWEGLQAIPEDQRTVLELAYFEGMSQSQISEHLSLPLGTIKTRVRLGVEKLERLLVAAGLQRGDIT